MGHALGEIPVWFRAQMTRLMGLKFAPADLRTHWEGLEDVPQAVLEAAVSLAQRTRIEFPTPAELRLDADAVTGTAPPVALEADRSVALPAPVVIGTLPSGRPVRVLREWQYACEVCNDSGVLSRWCGAESEARPPRATALACGRTVPHSPHAWADVCPCWDHNPQIQKRVAQRKAYAKAPRKAG